MSAFAYQASVDPSFRAVRISLIDGDRSPADHQVRLTLPDLSALRGSVAILRGELDNGRQRSQRARVRLGGIDRGAVDLAPGEGGRFAIVLSSGTARAITSGTAGQHEVSVAGENDDWRLTALDVTNAYAHAGAALAVVPAQVTAQPPAPHAAWALLVVLGLIAISSRASVWTGRLERAHYAAAGVVLVALALAWLLPLLSARRVLATPAIFWSAIGLLFLPAIAAAVRHAVSWSAAAVRAGARGWRRHPVACERGAILLGLVAMAIMQPLFDVLRASPEFFVARNTTAGTALGAVAMIALGLPLLLLAIERALERRSPAAATVFFLSAVAILLALMIHPWLRRGVIAGPWTMAAIAVGAGALLSLLTGRIAPFRQFLAALAPAAVVVPILFLGDGEVRGSLTPSLSNLQTPPLERTPPIVLVVFDELPVHSLLDAQGAIDQVRFPNFAALSREATWFREATTVSSQTVWAVPAIVSGGYPVTPNAVPTLRYYPQNLFTLLADRYEMHVFGRFLQLCGDDSCHREVEGPGDGPLELLADLGVVWLHIVSPAPLAERLPPVVGDWLGFARAGNTRSVGGRRVRNSRRGEFNRFLGTIDARPARLYFMHSLLPHMPFEFVPSERRYDAPDYQGRDEGGDGLFRRVGPEYADALHQRHLLQVGFVDTLIGRLVARLRRIGIYDEALVIITADHGASYREGLPRRGLSDGNRADILRVPLFIKRPGQRAGGIADGLVEVVDILPTIAEVLGMRLPFPVDGQPLSGVERPTRTRRTFINRDFKRIARHDVTDLHRSSQASLARRMARFGAGAYDPLYVSPGTGDVIGRALDDLPRRAGSLRIALAAPASFANVDPTSDTWPLHVRGRVFGRAMLPLAVAVNGRIVATTRVYQEKGASVFGTMIPEGALRPGHNDVAVFVIDRTGGTTSLVATVR